MIDKDRTSSIDEIAAILALGILRLRTRNKDKNSQNSMDFSTNGSIHDYKENGHEQ